MKKLILILAVVSTTTVSFSQENKFVEFSNPNGEAEVSWTTKVYDLGNLEQNTPAIAEFEFKNTGTVPLIITKIVASCGCTATDYSKEPIVPGATSLIKATYDAKSKGAFSKTVTVFTNAPEGRSVLTLKGKVG
jgi:Protein of unknown function (DUF1573)